MPPSSSLQATAGVDKRRVAIVFADLAESVRLMQHHESDAIERWRRFAAEVREELLPALGGRMVRMAGDGLLMECAQAPAAVALALRAHERIATYNAGRAETQAMLLRIGIHVADVLFDEHEAYGNGVNLAARLSSLAQPGQTVVSDTTRDELADGLHAELEDLGLRYVKHLDEPVRAFRATPVGTAQRPLHRLPLPSQDELVPAVAVVPFRALPAEAEDDMVGHALADDIIAALSRHAGLRVLSRTTTAALRHGLPDLAQVHRLLGASFLLTGHHYRHGQRVRVSVELCALPSGQVLWADTAVTEVDALFAGQDELVPRIVAQVGQQVLARELARVRGLPMDTLASYTLYLGATGLMNSLVLSDFTRARTALEHLVERHPRQAAAYAMLARWHVFRNVQGWAPDHALETQAARDQARKAIDIDPHNAVALGVEAMTRLSFNDDLEGARACYLQALQTDPQDSYCWAGLSAVHSHSGEHTQACDAAARAVALSPLDPNLFVFEAYAAMAALGAGLHKQAVTHAQVSLRHHALHAPTHRLLIAALWLDGREPDARLAAAHYVRFQPEATVGASWRAKRGPQSVWGPVFADALRAAGVPP